MSRRPETDLERAMREFCYEVSKLDSPTVEFFYDNGMTAALQIVKVPTLRVSVGGLSVTVDHEAVR